MDVMTEEARRVLRMRAAELKRPLSDLSKSIGKNHSYLQQYLERGIPRELPEKLRSSLAKELGVSEALLRGNGDVMDVSSGAGDVEQVSLSDVHDKSLREVLSSLLQNYRKAELWRVISYAMNDAAFTPGDYIIVDLNGDFRVPGCVVVAIQKSGNEQRALLRAHFPPKLIAVRNDPPALETVDNFRIIIRGVVVRRLR